MFCASVHSGDPKRFDPLQHGETPVRIHVMCNRLQISSINHTTLPPNAALIDLKSTRLAEKQVFRSVLRCDLTL